VGAAVEDAVVLLDRGQGGRDILQKAGIRLHRSEVDDGFLEFNFYKQFVPVIVPLKFYINLVLLQYCCRADK